MGNYLAIIRQFEQAHKQADLPASPQPVMELTAHTATQPRMEVVTIQAGDTITWQWRGRAQHGCVDFIHVDDTGVRWAFVTLLDGTLAVVNCKCASGVRP